MEKLSRADIDKLFRQLKSIFGSAFVHSYDNYDDAHEMWFSALKRFDRSDIKRGLAKCVECGKMFISLPEFVQMCKKNYWDSRLPIAVKSLPHFFDESLKNDAVAKMKKILGVK